MGKREKIKEYIQDEIRLARLKSGDRIYSRAVFMDKFQCARATVDKAIGDLISGKVLSAEKGSGTFVATPKKRTQAKNIAVVSPELTPNTMPQEIVQGFMEAVGPETSIRFFTYNELRHPKSWEACKAQRGIVFVMPDMQHGPFILEARSLCIPHVIAYRDIPESSFVSIDNTGAVMALVDHLISEGRRNIAYVGIPESRYHFPELRYIGYLTSLLKHKLAYNKNWCAFKGRQELSVTLNGLFGNGQCPDAIIAVSMPLGEIIRVAQKAGRKVGRNFSIATFDEVASGAYPFPVLSLRGIQREVGRESAAVLTRLFETQGKIVHKYITPEIKT
ncbi:MAG: hypothetical protein A2487_17040 [Candidatus Raymondbacteria bacterium RifOxyC12_full_50_8]|uniref:HTH gntR-type domain-containing protein n=1 Tax=Candidatus Raymondbacteria bacterium RIFOXYD12_FULL_49_13 TaxID=1817890 RepID=A0A1F7FHP4_UNCRA|nr:MAG: hypothetical protein A2248_09650 [Candidatus Raymondbacteria bacterium RIFOXYA2_FULL_49_16]OGJ91829.1 MAG: hypothetical protein A2350_21360 [Candidatus Raymondbacteria bacterium RifOxyB12_full_50_8]OGJ97168.1 MAG: hypothetical protein A2453_10295 [Candidatus Raymondbacteria bacterium RIFOXYC2_FULL_50_21]OGK04953.1 MAG: hypothetical protein A2487_17040 [Candidatus Raymondbacteria bacterium RifOxyC12_full_50_8]OGK06143.1 MAG: hypothetical protein A2519_22790 [Candidatus Raymondbacteria ba